MAETDQYGTLPSTERSATADLDAMTPLEIAMAFVHAAAAIAAAIEPETPSMARAIEALRDRLSRGGRLVLVGAGTSGRLAIMEASEVGPTFGLADGAVIAATAEAAPDVDLESAESSGGAEDDARAAIVAIEELGIGAADAVVGVAASGCTPFTLAALEAAAGRQALTVAVTCTHPSPMAEVADISIHPIVGPEVLTGSTRLAAGTATKIILDCLTTGVMAQLGHVYKGRMVDVRAGNSKLRDRAARIVADVTDASEPEAREALESTEWWARAAIIKLKLGLDPSESMARAAAFPYLEDALAEGEPLSTDRRA